MSRPRQLVFALALLLLVAAGLLALVRLNQTRIELTPAELEFTELHALDWNPATRELTVTGGDPFGFLVLPGGSTPLTGLQFNFDGEPREGGWYVYPAPVELPVITIEQKWVVTAALEPLADAEGFSATWTMRPSRAARLDLPDELTAPLHVRSVVFTSPFAAAASPIFAWLMTTATLGAALLLGASVWRWSDHVVVQLLFAGLLVAAKASLVSTMGLTVFSNAMHDDKLFMDQGMSIAAGDWLGPYWQLTLAKGPTYSVFLALSSLSGWPLQINEALLHGLGCLAFVAALSPWLRGAGWRLALLIVLLFEPHSLSGEELSRVLRAGVQPGLTLLTLAGLVGLLTRIRTRWWRALPWAILGGLGGGAFWLSREEGVWLMPTALLLLGGAAWSLWSAPRPTSARLAWCTLLLLPPLLFQSVRQTVRWLNHAHYGVPITVDVSEGAFPMAYGAMVRVTPSEQIPGVPVTKETRLRIYEISPAFAELQDDLENYLAPEWAKLGWWEEPDSPHAYQEVKGGWYQWAIRQAAHRAGYYASATAAEAYWQRVADEINTACDEGRIAGGRPRSGFFPAWQSSYNLPAMKAWFKAVDLLVRFSDFKPTGVISRGSPEDIERYATFLNSDPLLELAPPDRFTAARMILRRIFASLGWPLTVLALVATGFVVRRALRPGALDARLHLIVLLSLWGGAAALCAVCALVHVSSFTALIGAYLGPACPMILACWVLAPVWAWRQPALPSSS